MKKINSYWISLSILVLFIILLQWVLPLSSIGMQWYKRWIYSPIHKLTQVLFLKTSWSWGDVIYIFGGVILLALLLWAIVDMIQKRGFQKFRIFILSLSATYLLFLLQWGVLYKSEPIYSRHKAVETLELKKDDFVELAHFFLDRIDTLLLVALEQEEFKDITLLSERVMYDKVNPDFHWKIKTSLFNQTIRKMRVSGFYNPFTSEAYVYDDLPKSILPFVCLHELAHQNGVAREGDANFFAYELGIRSQEPYFQLSSYFQAFLYAIAYLKKNHPFIFNQLYKELPLPVANSYQTYQEYIKKDPSWLGALSNNFYDSFLKIQGQEKGLKTYSSFLKWIYDKEIKGYNTFEQTDGNL